MMSLLLVHQIFLDVFEFWVFYLLDHSDDRNDEIGHKIEKDDGLDGNWVAVVTFWESGSWR